MYLANSDKTIQQKLKQVKELNEQIIKDYENLPFWRRWTEEENVKLEVYNNLRRFRVWMEIRMNRKGQEDDLRRYNQQQNKK